jgi:hypothetical protein
VAQKINLISPPDTLFNNNFTFSLINTTPKQQEEVSMWLAKNGRNEEINVHVYNNETMPTWVLNVVNGKNPVFINLDNTSDVSVHYTSYILSMGHTYYFTEDKNSKAIYELINNNCTKDITAFMDKIYDDRQDKDI